VTGEAPCEGAWKDPDAQPARAWRVCWYTTRAATETPAAAIGFLRHTGRVPNRGVTGEAPDAPGGK
jgi:hypothetical protein